MSSLVVRRLAKLVSIFTHPALLVSVTTTMVVYRYTDSFQEFWQGSLIGIGLVVGPALLYSLNVWRRDGTVDLDLSNRQERIVPLMLACLGAVYGAYLVETHLHSEKFVEIAFILVTLLAAITVITTVWKISVHTAALSALVTLLVIFRGEVFAVGYLILIPIAWSRLYLKQHTRNQLLAGAVLGVALTAVSAWFFRP